MAALLYLIIFLFTLGQLGRISLFNQQINFYFYEIITLFFLGVGLFRYQLLPIKKIIKESKSLFYFLIILFISLIIGFNKFTFFQNFVGFLYFLRLVLYLIYWVYLNYWIKKEKKKSTLFKALYFSAILFLITTLVQYFLYPDLRNLIYLGWDPHLYRTFGVFFDTSVAAAIYGILFFLIDKMIIKSFFLLFLALSFSRGAYFSFMISLSYFFLTSKQFKKLFFYILIFFILVLVIPKPFGEGVNLLRSFSIISRLKDYQEGFNIFIKKPLLGYGYNRIKYLKEDASSHSSSAFSSSYLTILVSSGLLGLFSFFGFGGYIWKKAAKYRSIILYVGVASFFDNLFLHPFVLFFLLTILSDS